MQKTFFKLLRQSTLTIFLGLSCLSFTQATTLDNIKATLMKLGIDNVQQVYSNKETTLVNTPYGMFTFIGTDGTQFTGKPLIKFFNKESQLGNIKFTYLVQLLKDFKTQLINISPQNPTGHLYVIDNINCPHCQEVLHNYQKFLDAGYALTFVPFNNNQEEELKVSYVLQQPASKRFEAFNKDPAQMPMAKTVDPTITKLQNLLNLYGIQQYPIFIKDDGLSQPGFAGVVDTLKYFADKNIPYIYGQ